MPDVALTQQVQAPAKASPTVESLLLLVALQDRQAFAELYAWQQPIIRITVHRLLRDFHQAEEVTQEILLQIWQRASRFDPARGSAAAWILQIARARAIDRIRHCQASRARDKWHTKHDARTDFDAVAEVVLAGTDVLLVRDALLKVSALQREALILVYFTDHTCADTAEMLHIPLATLKTRVRDGILRIRRNLDLQEKAFPSVA